MQEKIYWANFMENKKVSVAMATYNGEKFIKEQISSILLNLSDNDELIISDDGSTDKTIEIIKSFNDSRILIFDGPKKGFVKNFEYALRNCNGDYIFLCDQDDVWFNKKVSTIVSLLDTHMLVCHNAEILNGETRSNELVQDIRGCRSNFSGALFKNSYIGCCMAFKKELLKFVLPFPNKLDSHDWWIGVIANKVGDSYFLPEPLIYYRIHEKNSLGFKKKGLFFKVSKRFHMIEVYLRWLKEYKL